MICIRYRVYANEPLAPSVGPWLAYRMLLEEGGRNEGAGLVWRVGEWGFYRGGRRGQPSRRGGPGRGSLGVLVARVGYILQGNRVGKVGNETVFLGGGAGGNMTELGKRELGLRVGSPEEPDVDVVVEGTQAVGVTLKTVAFLLLRALGMKCWMYLPEDTLLAKGMGPGTRWVSPLAGLGVLVLDTKMERVGGRDVTVGMLEAGLRVVWEKMDGRWRGGFKARLTLGGEVFAEVEVMLAGNGVEGSVDEGEDTSQSREISPT